MSGSLRCVEDTVFAAAAAIDGDTERFHRQMRYQAERDRKNHVVYTDESATLMSSDEDVAKRALDRAMYWDTLRALDSQDALIVVLRYCMGYSATEIAVGLGLSYAQVKYRCKLRKH